jgi:hypothetical protein
VTEDAAVAGALGAYYTDPHVRRRVREYCGDTGDGVMTAVFLAALTGGAEPPRATWEYATLHPPDALDQLLADDADISRSLWDTRGLLVHLDIDYQNTDYPGEAWHHPADVFFKLEPAYRAVRHLLRRFDLPLVAVMTGQGYHFTGIIPLDSPVIDRLARLLPEMPNWLPTIAERHPGPRPELTLRHARAYGGLGLVMEYLAHGVMRRARRRTPVPIVLNGTVVGSGLAGRDCVSIDLSCYGDPLDVRHIRVAFSAYQKHRFRPDVVGIQASTEVPPLVAVPRCGALAPLPADARDVRHAARAARTGSAVLPEAARGVGRLVDAYLRSSLAEFHRKFYATRRRTPAGRDELFGAVRLAALPKCVARPLAEPNDLLLRPAHIQHVTRWFLAEGVAPRDIAALVQSRYEGDFDWGEHWRMGDAETRAEFDVRVFAGLIVTGVDGAVDFNCRSAQEKGLCASEPCGHDLRVDQQRLLAMVHR